MSAFFINAGLLAGVGLAAVPVLLHLFLRQTPKRIIFPALRLVQERQRRSRRILRIKNWLLLLARIALVVLMALALARPRLWSKTTLGDRDVPTALAVVIDTSLSMEYRERDKTRLEDARQRARELLEKAHESSRVFVLDSADPGAVPPLSPAAARKRLDGLTPRAVNRPLNAAVAQARKLVAEVDLPRREVFILTDLTRSAWELGRPVAGYEPKAQAAATKGAAGGKRDEGPDPLGIATYVVRLAAGEVRDVAIASAEPEGDVTPENEPVPIRAVVRSTGPAAKRFVELFVDDQKRDQQEVNLGANAETAVRFLTPKLPAGLHRAELRLAGEPDPLEITDRRFLTLDVQPPLKVLVVSDLAIDADFVEFALDPLAYRSSGGSRPFPVTRASPSQLSSLGAPLKDFACVFLLNVARLADADWGKLNQYVREGGGLVIALGDRVAPDTWNSTAGGLLPGTIRELITPPAGTDFTFGRADIAHPLFERERDLLLTDLASVPVFRYRSVVPLEGVRSLLSYQDDAPALLERVFPGPRPGHVLLWTTALSRRPGTSAADRAAAWNDFPITGWSFFAILNRTVPYLAGLSGRRLDYDAGEDVVVPLRPGRRYTGFSLQAPGPAPAQRLGEPTTGSGLLIPSPPLIGPWTVTATSPAGPPEKMGFSVNVPASEVQLATLTEPELTGLFGSADRYRLVNDADRLERDLREGRVGRELFPLVMALILLVVSLETVLANTFYREAPKGATAVGPTRTRS
jgi:hypothetical protein